LLRLILQAVAQNARAEGDSEFIFSTIVFAWYMWSGADCIAMGAILACCVSPLTILITREEWLMGRHNVAYHVSKAWSSSSTNVSPSVIIPLEKGQGLMIRCLVSYILHFWPSQLIWLFYSIEICKSSSFPSSTALQLSASTPLTFFHSFPAFLVQIKPSYPSHQLHSLDRGSAN
jgi:hypothetical protein